MGEVKLNILDFKACRRGSGGKLPVVTDEGPAARAFSAPNQRRTELEGIPGFYREAIQLRECQFLHSIRRRNHYGTC